MRAAIIGATALLLAGSDAARAADAWGIENEKPMELNATVVDIACRLTGDCPADCGAGRRQLGLLTDEGRLLPAAKGNVFFAGATVDLLPYCGRKVMTDGLLIESPAMPLYFVQSLRESPAEPWRPAEAFLTAWKAGNGEAEEWWRADPTIKAAIAKDGVLGIPGTAPKK